MIRISIIVGICVLVFIAFTYVFNKRIEKKLRSLDKNRPKLSKSDFIELLENKGYPKEHSAAVHMNISEYLRIKNFSIYPEDDIHKDYSITDLDDVDLIDKICKDLNIESPQQSDFDELGLKFEQLSVESILHLTKKLAD